MNRPHVDLLLIVDYISYLVLIIVLQIDHNYISYLSLTKYPTYHWQIQSQEVWSSCSWRESFKGWCWHLTACQACELGSYIFRLQVLLVTYRWYSDTVAATRLLHDVAQETAGIGWRKFGSVSVTSGSGPSIYPVRPSLGPDWPFGMDPLSFSSWHSLKPKDTLE